MCNCIQQFDYMQYYQPNTLDGWLKDNWKVFVSPLTYTVNSIRQQSEQVKAQETYINESNDYLQELEAANQQLTTQVQSRTVSNEIPTDSMVPGISNSKLMLYGGGAVGVVLAVAIIKKIMT